MAAKLTWLDATGQPRCGHSRAVGRPGDVPGEWWCDLCAAHIDAALDQELAAVAEEGGDGYLGLSAYFAKEDLP